MIHSSAVSFGYGQYIGTKLAIFPHILKFKRLFFAFSLQNSYLCTCKARESPIEPIGS